MQPLLEYAVPVWDPHLKKDVMALKSVQRLATKICTKTWNTATYEDRLSALKLSTLKSRRRYLKLCYQYKIINNLSFFPNFPLTIRPVAYTTRSHDLTLHNIPHSRTDSFSYSFFCHTPNLWNKLSSTVVLSTSLSSFKRTVMDHLQSH